MKTLDEMLKERPDLTDPAFSYTDEEIKLYNEWMDLKEFHRAIWHTLITESRNSFKDSVLLSGKDSRITAHTQLLHPI